MTAYNGRITGVRDVIKKKREWIRRSCPPWVWAGGIGVLTVSVLTGLITRSPYGVRHIAETVLSLPPLWLMALGGHGMAFALGCAWGYTWGLHRRGPRGEITFLRVSLWNTLSVIGAMTWYAWLFGSGLPLLSWLCLGVAVGAAIMAVLVCRGISVGVTAIAVAWALWLWGLFTVQLVVMLHI